MHTYICYLCNRKVVFTVDGPVHQGGSFYLQRCDTCGNEADRFSPACPRCGEVRGWKDDHAVRPVTAAYITRRGRR